VPLFNILLAVWGTLLLEGWKRRNATKAFEWGVLDKEDQSASEVRNGMKGGREGGRRGGEVKGK